MERYLIKGALILSEDAQIGVLQKGDIFIDSGMIAAVSANLNVDDAVHINADGMIAMPGFVDAHRHNWESLLRCMGVDWTLTQYFTAVKKILGPAFSTEDLYLASYLGGLECLDCGITTLFDWFHNNNSPECIDAVIQGLKDSGVRVVLGYSNSIFGELPVSQVPLDYCDYKRVKRQYFANSSDMFQLALATRGPQFEIMDLALDEIALAKDTGTPVFMHVGDGSWGRSQAIKKLFSRGVLDDTFTFVHCNTLLDEELEIIADVGAGAVSCPEVELNMGHGFLRTVRQKKLGIEIGLGVDVVTSVPGDMFGAMRYMLASVRAVENEQCLANNVVTEELPLKATDVFHFATQGGANVCKMGDITGSITLGKRADIILLNTDEPNIFPVNNPVGAVVEAAHPGNVDTVFVDGKLVKHNKQLLCVDFKSLKSRVLSACDALFSRSGISDVQTWKPVAYAVPPPVN